MGGNPTALCSSPDTSVVFTCDTNIDLPYGMMNFQAVAVAENGFVSGFSNAYAVTKSLTPPTLDGVSK